jgi:hypothetical protein
MASARTFTAYKPIRREVHLEVRTCEKGGPDLRIPPCAGDTDDGVYHQPTEPQVYVPSASTTQSREVPPTEKQGADLGTVCISPRNILPESPLKNGSHLGLRTQGRV